MLQDVQDYDTSKAAIARGDEALVPSEVVHAILDGENPIQVWRQHRGLSRQELAANAGITLSYLSQLETNERAAPLDVLSALAKALNAPPETLTSTEAL